jgi:DNA-binding MarR family transcriptional regulator
MGWTDPSADADGYVPFAEIKRSLVHSAAALSRRIADLRADGYVEIRKASAAKGAGAAVDKRQMVVRITNSGIDKIRPVYEKWCRLCENLLRDIPSDDARALLRINESLIKRIRGDV